MQKKKSNTDNKITYQINTKKRNIIIITVLTVIILLAGITTGIILYNKNNDDGSTNMVEVTTTEQEAKATTEVATAKKPSKKKEATTERPISCGVNPPTTEAPKHNSEKTTEAPKNDYKPQPQQPATEAPTEAPTERATEAPTTEHQHQWTKEKWTETIEHPGEEVYGCECDDCGFWCTDPAVMEAHQDDTGHNGYSEYARSTEPTTETITHHRRVCSCGAKEDID